MCLSQHRTPQLERAPRVAAWGRGNAHRAWGPGGADAPPGGPPFPPPHTIVRSMQRVERPSLPCSSRPDFGCGPRERGPARFPPVQQKSSERNTFQVIVQVHVQEHLLQLSLEQLLFLPQRLLPPLLLALAAAVCAAAAAAPPLLTTLLLKLLPLLLLLLPPAAFCSRVCSCVCC